MSLYRPSLQSAPELRGDIGAPSAWSGSSTADPTITGTYTGRDSVTYTFTAGGSGTMTIGTTASIPVTWSDGTETGVLNLGTDASYAADDVIPLDKGMSIAFDAGTVIAAETFTLAVVAAYRLRRDHKEIKGDADPVATDRLVGDIDDGDEYFENDQGDLMRYARAARRKLQLEMKSLGRVEYGDLLHLQHERHPLTVYENYGAETLLSFRGGTADPDEDGLLPVVGSHATFARSGVAAYEDPDTGLWRIAADGVPRYQYGPEIVSTEIEQVVGYTRFSEGRKAAMGKALTIAKAATNLLPYFHPKSGALAWVSDTGSPTLTWDTGVPGVLDPTDTGWGSGYADGSVHVEMAATEAIRSVNTFTVSAATTYVIQIYVKGRGTLIASLMAGAGAASNARSNSAMEVDSADWMRWYATATTAAGDNTAQLKIAAATGSAIYISAAQVELGENLTGLIQTTGASATRNVETVTLDQALPVSAGTISWWWHHGGDDHVSHFPIFEANGGGRFRIVYVGTDVLRFETETTGAVTGTVDAKYYTWNHGAVTWEAGNAGTIDRSVYFNGALANTSTNSSAWAKDWGSELQLFKQIGGLGAPAENRIFDLRIEKRALSATEIEGLYNRVASATQRQTYMETAGRRFFFRSLPGKWLDRANPDKLTVSATLRECGANRDALIVAR